MSDTAAMYILNLLDGEELQRFQQDLAANPALATETRELRETAAALADSLPPAAPPPALRSRVLALASAPEVGLGALRAGEGRWKPAGAPGITYKRLYVDEESGLVTMLVRMEPGSIWPGHTHQRTEQCLVLEGDLIHDDHIYGPGDFTWAKAGTIDPELRTENGNLLLLITAP